MSEAVDVDEKTFWSHVKKGDGEDACWIWTGAKNDKGYGICKWQGATERAHRVAYTLEKGPIPDGKELMHTCKPEPNTSCVRPSHLKPGTSEENNKERASRASAQIDGSRGGFTMSGPSVDVVSFWDHVKKGEGSDACWEWTGPKDSKGFGSCEWMREPELAHRVAYIMDKGPIPDGKEPVHTCNNNSCVRASHLKLEKSKTDKEESTSRASEPKTLSERLSRLERDARRPKLVEIASGRDAEGHIVGPRFLGDIEKHVRMMEAIVEASGGDMDSPHLRFYVENERAVARVLGIQSSSIPDGASRAWEAIQGKARQLREADPLLTPEKAVALAVQQEPELYEQYQAGMSGR